MPGETQQPALRERQQQQTRTSILEAFLELSHRAGAVNVSVPAIAASCGISTRTIYRYFANKDELQTAAAYHLSQQALGGDDILQADETNMLDMLKMMWTAFDENRSWLAAEHSTPAGRALRTTRLDGNRETVRKALPDGASEESVDLIVAVTSSSMFLELVGRMEYAPEVAAAMAARLAGLVLADEQATATPKQDS